MWSNQHGSRGSRGFTLVEVIVMMSVLTLGILATLAVANFAVQAGSRNEQQATAVNLAREGVEMVRAIRDSNWSAMAEETGPRCWDYYADSDAEAGQPPPGSCNPRFQDLSAATNFVVYLNVGNGTPFLNPIGTAPLTEHSLYRLCQDSRGLYVPKPAVVVGGGAGPPCSSGRTYYRRVTIRRVKDLGIDVDDGKRKYSILVQSRVTWPNRGASDIIVEEYLTDWRKF